MVADDLREEPVVAHGARKEEGLGRRPDAVARAARTGTLVLMRLQHLVVTGHPAQTVGDPGLDGLALTTTVPASRRGEWSVNDALGEVELGEVSSALSLVLRRLSLVSGRPVLVGSLDGGVTRGKLDRTVGEQLDLLLGCDEALGLGELLLLLQELEVLGETLDLGNQNVHLGGGVCLCRQERIDPRVLLTIQLPKTGVFI